MEISLLLSASQAVPTDVVHRLSHTRPLLSSSLPDVVPISLPKPLPPPPAFSSSSLLSETPSPPPPRSYLDDSQNTSFERLPPFSRLATRVLNLAPQDARSVDAGRIEKKSAKPFKCTYDGCEATFGQKGSLTRHIRSRHQKLRPHSCDLCQKSFSALWTLRVHQRNVHFKSKPHKCHLCDKSFGELFNKSKHIAIVHEGKRPFSCPICSRAFGYKGDMRKHVLELHEQSGRPFQCIIPSCGVKFARKRYLRRHENLSHKGHPMLATRELPSSPEAMVTGATKQGFYLGPAVGAADTQLGYVNGVGVDTGSSSATESANSTIALVPKFV